MIKSNIMSNKTGSIREDRSRTNFLKEAEYTTIEFICRWMPRWVTPDMLTGFGVVGALVVFLGLHLASYSKMYLLVSVLGLVFHWFGDSLDGRIAYYRNTPRKWYGWALDIHADWISTIIIGLGFYFYLNVYQWIAFIFVVAYGGGMLVALLRYKINDKYIIDSQSFGPTELRILLALVLITEIFFSHILLGFGFIGSGLLILFNTLESIKVLEAGDLRDAQERAAKKIISSN